MNQKDKSNVIEFLIFLGGLFIPKYELLSHLLNINILHRTTLNHRTNGCTYIFDISVIYIFFIVAIPVLICTIRYSYEFN